MTKDRKRNLWPLALVALMLGASTTLVIVSPTLYRLYCAVTGYGGTVNRAVAKNLAPTAGETRTITIFFDANVAPGLPWSFRPMQRKVVARLGEPTRIYYYAKNNSDRTVVARALFNITPYRMASYFFKIECFCFTNEKLGPGESAKMPVELYVDEEMAKDKNMSDIHEITLSYTFYPQDSASPDVVSQARALKAGSDALEAKLQQSKKATFENDAPRR
jgi:cytochrome c oxidase assembly protein subunit 11